MAVKNVKGSPLAGLPRMSVAALAADTKDEYTFGEVIELIDSAVSVSYNVSSSEVPYYASDKKVASDYTQSPTGSIGYSGDTYELSKLLYGMIDDGGALLDNMGRAPEISVIAQIKTLDGWAIWHITKATAARDDVPVTTKRESITYTDTTATLSCLASTYFNTYRRVFDSNNPALAGKTADEVFDAILADPMTKFDGVDV